MTWYEFLITAVIGILIGGLASYVLFYPIYEALNEFEDVFTKECNAINNCWTKIIETQNTLKETVKIQGDTVNKIKETLEKIK